MWDVARLEGRGQTRALHFSAMSAAGRFQNLVLEDVEETSKELGRGSYGVVIEVNVSGTKCAAKKIHSMLLQHDVEVSQGVRTTL